MDRQAQNIQEAFLNNARKEKDFPHDLFDERSEAFLDLLRVLDKYSVVLETNNQEQRFSNMRFSRLWWSHVPSTAPHMPRERAMGLPGFLSKLSKTRDYAFWGAMRSFSWLVWN